MIHVYIALGPSEVSSIEEVSTFRCSIVYVLIFSPRT